MYTKYKDLWMVELLFDDLLDWSNWFFTERTLAPLNMTALGGDDMQYLYTTLQRYDHIPTSSNQRLNPKRDFGWRSSSGAYGTGPEWLLQLNKSACSRSNLGCVHPNLRTLTVRCRAL